MIRVPSSVTSCCAYANHFHVFRWLSGAVVGVLAIFLIRVSGARVSDRVTLVEVSKEFVKTLNTVRKMDTQGRMLVHEKFGK